MEAGPECCELLSTRKDFFLEEIAPELSDERDKIPYMILSTRFYPLFP